MTDTGFTSLLEAPGTMDADFEATVSFTSPADAVFDALTTPSGLTGWWMKASGSGLAGGELTFVNDDNSVVVRVDTAERPSVVRWTVLAAFGPFEDWLGMTISFDVSPDEGGGARLHFRHTGLTPQLECFDTCSAGWNHYLPRLVAYVDSGRGNPVASDGERIHIVFRLVSRPPTRVGREKG
ncbi:MAG: SRPBCC family protein, partial [Thermomicrobiales bacterium]